MAIDSTPPRQRGAEDRGTQAPNPDRSRERVAQAHDRSADIFERHAVLLDRYGAHRSARTERRHAEDERRAAQAARQRPTPRPAGREPSYSR